MHAQSSENFEHFRSCRAYETAFALKAEGKIRHVGISFHDSPEMLEKILDTYPEIEVVQIQFNYLDYENPNVQSRAVYEVLERYGKPVLIMEPVKGGTLVELPARSQAVLDALGGGSNASYAVRFAAGFPQVCTVLSGMSDLAQIEDNTSTMKDFRPLDEREQAAVARVRELYLEEKSIPCTNCRYCAPGCPMSISIPDIFQARNKDLVYGDRDGALGFYKMVSAGAPASQCVGCGQCEAACPQHIGIIDALKEIAADYDK
jgi:predicted aldo/keto reductase-like oxidoreductase